MALAAGDAWALGAWSESPQRNPYTRGFRETSSFCGQSHKQAGGLQPRRPGVVSFAQRMRVLEQQHHACRMEEVRKKQRKDEKKKGGGGAPAAKQRKDLVVRPRAWGLRSPTGLLQGCGLLHLSSCAAGGACHACTPVVGL